MPNFVIINSTLSDKFDSTPLKQTTKQFFKKSIGNFEKNNQRNFNYRIITLKF